MDESTRAFRSRRRFLGATGAAVAAGALSGCVGRVRSYFQNEPIDLEGDPAEHADAQFRDNLQRQGVYPEATIPESVTVDWRFPDVNTGDHTAAKASPVEAPDGNVVVPGDTGEVWSVSPEGEQQWVADTEVSPRGFHGTPAIANDAVYVGAYDGALYAFDLETGQQYWESHLGDAIGSSPGYYDGTVYVAVEYHDPSGAMFAVDAVNGDVEWDDQTPSNHPHSTCAIDLEAGRLVVGDNDGVLHGWSFPDLELEWQFETGDSIKGPVATYDGSAFFGSWDDNVYRVALDDGTEEWAYDTGRSVMSGPSIEPSTGRLYVGSHDYDLYALDLESGNRVWSFDTGGTLLGCPTVTSEHVLTGSYDGRLYAVDKDDGEEVWHVQTDGWVTSTPLVTEDAIYFTNRASEEYVESGGDEGESGALYRLVADE